MRKYIVGIMIGIILAFPLGAHAEVIVNMIGKSIDGAFPVKIDGKVLDNQAIVVEGTSYLPVRAFGEATGYDVKFDADLGITLTKNSTVTDAVYADPNIIEQQARSKKFQDLNKQSQDLQKQIESMYQVIRPYENIGVFDGKMGPQKEPDDIYNSTKRQRDDYISQRDAIEAQLQALLK